jgi:hypothetical protein
LICAVARLREAIQKTPAKAKTAARDQKEGFMDVLSFRGSELVSPRLPIAAGITNTILTTTARGLASGLSSQFGLKAVQSLAGSWAKIDACLTPQFAAQAVN